MEPSKPYTLNPKDKPVALFAVYDGHFGPKPLGTNREVKRLCNLFVYIYIYIDALITY